MNRLAVLAAALVLAACSSEGYDGYDQKAEWKVAGDENASPAEIINAGGPAAVAESGGQRLVTWTVNPDDDEGPHQGAWRLYGKDGEPVAEGRWPQVREAGAVIGAVGVDDGFVLSGPAEPRIAHIDREGELTPLKEEGAVKVAQRGDIVLHDAVAFDVEGGSLIYRPTDRSVRLLKVSNYCYDTQIDAAGTVWVLCQSEDLLKAEVRSSTGGKWRVHDIDAPAGETVLSQSLALGDGQAFLVYGTFDADWAEPKTLMRWDGTRWAATPIEIDAKRTTVVAVDVLPDGRVVVLPDGTHPLVEMRGGGWAAMKPPSGLKEQQYTIQVVGEWVWLWDYEGRTLLYSRDNGESWTEFDR